MVNKSGNILHLLKFLKKGDGDFLLFVDTPENNHSSLRGGDESVVQQKGYCLALSCVAVGIKGILRRGRPQAQGGIICPTD